MTLTVREQLHERIAQNRAPLPIVAEEQRRTSRNKFGEGGFNPTITERRLIERGPFPHRCPGDRCAICRWIAEHVR